MISWRINDVFSIFIIPFPVILSPGWFSSPKSPRTSTGQAEFSGMPAPIVVAGVDWSLGYSFPVSFFLQSYVSTLWCRGSGTMPGSLHQVLSCLSSTQKHLLKKCEERSRHLLLGNNSPVQHPGDSGDPLQTCFYVSLCWSQQPGCEPEEEGNG